MLLVSTGAASEVRPVVLEIANAGEERLRCVMVIAHFMSEPLGTIEPAARLSIELERDGVDGTLFRRSADGRRKPIENILCGAGNRWSETRGDVPLLPLRSTRSGRVMARCHLQPSLSCALGDVED